MIRFLRGHSWTAAYLVLCLAVGIGFAVLVDTRNDQERQRDALRDAQLREVEDRQESACVDRNTTKSVLVQLVKLTNSGGTRVDLTALPSFEDLDRATQQYLSDLNALLNAPRTSPNEDGKDLDGDGDVDFADRALALITFEDCSAAIDLSPSTSVPASPSATPSSVPATTSAPTTTSRASTRGTTSVTTTSLIAPTQRVRCPGGVLPNGKCKHVPGPHPRRS